MTDAELEKRYRAYLTVVNRRRFDDLDRSSTTS
jgi:hypothetical protein